MIAPLVGIIPEERKLVLFMPCGCVQTHDLSNADFELGHAAMQGEGWVSPINVVTLTTYGNVTFGKAFPTTKFLFHGSEDACSTLLEEIKTGMVNAGIAEEFNEGEEE